MGTLLWIAAAMAAVGAAMAEPAAAARPPRADALVGVFYFPGWASPDRWYCMKANPHVQHPLLGYYREGAPEVAEQHIKWALDHGVGFFAYDYYSQQGSEMLEHALAGLMAAPSIGKFRFALNWCNHAPVETMTDDELDRFGEVAVRKYLRHPSYLRIDGKPVLIILSGHSFVKNLGVERARAAFARLEKRCKDAGLPGLYLAFCEGMITSEKDVQDSLAAGAQAFCLYNYPYYGTDFTGPGRGGEAPYSDLVARAPGLWQHWADITGGRFWPTVMPGWDRRPWTKDNDLVRTGATAELFERSLRDARKHLNPQRIVMIEAWNEWGEGSILEPSVEQGFAYLDRVREVFCPGAPPHKDARPSAKDVARMAYDLRLPSTDAWTFDFGVDGWTRSGATEPAAEWGALTLTTQNGDPQLTSPLNYLDAARYRAVSIRMRAIAPEGGAGEATGQLFWQTVDHGLSEKAVATFTVPLDGEWHTYVIEVGKMPGWKGTVDRFRLDPVNAAGVRLWIDEVRVLRGAP